MIPALTAEFKKLLTVRSTYLLVLIALFLTTFFTYLGTAPATYEEFIPNESVSSQGEESQTGDSEGGAVKNQPISSEDGTVVTHVSHDLAKEKIFLNLQEMLPVVTLFFAIVVVLLMAHEFRHNTITYTLTSSNSRSKVLVSKIIVATVFTITATLLAIGFTVASTYAAISIKDLNLPSQDYNWGYIIARLLGYALGYSLIMLAIITLIRNIIAGIVAIFVLPTINEIAGALLSIRNIEATKVLPFSALGRISSLSADLISSPGLADDGFTDPQRLPATLLGSSLVFAAYLVGVWIIAWILFLKRDAN